jgi:hypothetical protein
VTWYYESDGGGWHDTHRSYRQPKTHYVTNREGERIDCESRAEGIRLARSLNQKEEHHGSSC